MHNPRQFESDLPSFVARNQVDFLVYSNANHKLVSALEDFRGFHVVRDPRDIVVSSYFSHLHSHTTTDFPELVEHRRELQAVDKERGLYLVIDFLEGVLGDIASWDYADPRVLELKMEDVVRAPAVLLLKAYKFLGLIDDTQKGFRVGVTSAASTVKRWQPLLIPLKIVPLPASVLMATLQRNAFELKTGGRAAGVENVSSHYRKGVQGDWVNHFGPRHNDYFKARYGDLLMRLGYEQDLNW